MKKILLGALKLSGIRLAFDIICIVFLVAFTWLIGLKNGFIIYSVCCTLLYMLWVFSNSSRNGEIDKHVNNKRLYYGFAEGILSETVTVILLAAVFFSGDAFVGMDIVYAVWNAPYFGFLIPNGQILTNSSVNIMYLLIIFIVPVVNGVAYLMGWNRAEVLGADK